MTTKVHGKIFLLNGQIATLLTMGGKAINSGKMSGVMSKVIVDKGIVEIEYQDGINPHLNKGGPFWLYHITKDLLDNFIFAKEVVLNKCLLFLPEYYIQDGNMVYFEGWQIEDKTEVDEKTFISLLAGNSRFRDGVRNYHLGLYDVTNCPTHFYSAVEIFASLVMNKDGQPKDSEFETFLSKIELTDSEKGLLDKLKRMYKSYHHGVRSKEGIENYLELMFITKIIVLKTANYLERLNQQNLKP